jgi:hypothetical protein
MTYYKRPCSRLCNLQQSIFDIVNILKVFRLLSHCDSNAARRFDETYRVKLLGLYNINVNRFDFLNETSSFQPNATYFIHYI